MTGAPRFVLPYQTVEDPAGVPIPGALLNFYYSETSTRAPTYSDPTLETLNTNPVEANDAGMFGNIFLNPAVSYKVVLTGPDDGVNPPDEIWTADPVNALAVFYPVAFEFLGSTPDSNEIMGMHTFTNDVSFPAGFDGAAGFCVADPAAPLMATMYKQDATPVGTMTISAGGVFTFTSQDDLAIRFLAQETLLVKGPAISVAGLANASWTLPGVLVS